MDQFVAGVHVDQFVARLGALSGWYWPKSPGVAGVAMICQVAEWRPVWVAGSWPPHSPPVPAACKAPRSLQKHLLCLVPG